MHAMKTLHRRMRETAFSRRREDACRLGRAWALAAVLAVPWSVHAAEFELVTPEEYAEAMSADASGALEVVPKSVPGGPRIEVLAPRVDAGSIASPVDIEVRFEPHDGAKIDMSSLKVYYLMLIKKDVTERILEHAELGESSIRAPGAKLPAGRHKFLVEISDSEARKSSERFVVDVDA